MSNFKLQVTLAAIAVFWAPQGVAQTVDSTSTVLLKQVVVSATRINQEAFDVGRSVSVISEEDINSTIYQSVGELLQSLEGVDVVGSLQNPGTNQSLFLRGANSNHVTVMVDGIRISDPSTPNSALDLSELSLVNVERIEIVRGSHSTMYGGSAIGGVVNIITKKSADDGIGGSLDFGAGTLGKGTSRFSQQAGVSYARNGFYTRAELFNLHVNGFDVSTDTVSSPLVFKTADNDDFSKTDFTIASGYDKNKVNLFLSYKRIDQEVEIDDGAFNDDDNYVLNFSRNLFNYGADYDLKDGVTVSLRGGFTDSQREAVDDSSHVDQQGNFDQTYFESKHNGDLLTNEVQYSHQWNKSSLLVGLGNFSEDMSFRTFFFSDGAFGPFQFETNYDSLNTATSTSYAFIQSRLDGALAGVNGLALNVGGRFTYHSRFGTNITYQVNPTFRVGSATVLYLSYATGFNAPSLVQLYDPSQGFGSLTSRGNLDLEPESSSSWEIGFKQLIGDKGIVTASLFATTVQDAIEYVYFWDPSVQIQNLGFAEYRGDSYLNIGEQRIKGLDATLKLRPHAKLAINLGYSYIDTELKVSSDDLDQAYTQGHHVQIFNTGQFVNGTAKIEELARRPSHLLNTSLRYYPIEKMQIGISLRIVDTRPDPVFDSSLGPFGALSTTPIDGYTLVDSNAKYLLNDTFAIALKVENVFDEQYSVIRGFNTRQRSFTMKLSAQF